MELRSCGHLHFIQAIKGGAVTKTLNVTRGRPTFSIKKVTDLNDSFMIDKDQLKVERSCTSVMERRTIKTESDASACNTNDDHDERSCDLDDNSFGNITLKQIKERCKTRKRKHLQGLDSSKRKIKIEASSYPEDCKEKQMMTDDSDFMETLSSWKSKLSKNMKTNKRRRTKDMVSTFIREIVPVVKSEEIQNSAEFPSTSQDSTALVEVKSEVPETDCLNNPKKFSCISSNASSCHGPENSFRIVANEEPEIASECNLENELNYEWNEYADIIPLQIVWDSSMDNVLGDLELTSNQSLNLPAVEYESKESIIHPDPHCISPKAVSLDQDHADIYHDQPVSYAPVTLPNVVMHEGLHCMDLGNEGRGASSGDCSKDEFTSDPNVQAKTSSVSEHSFSSGGCLPFGLDYSHEAEEKQSLGSTYIDEERHISKGADELTSWDGCESSSKQHRPQRLLSARKAISPSSQERLCKAMRSIELQDKDYLKCRGKLYFGEQTEKKKDNAEAPNVIMKARFADNPNKVDMELKTPKRGSHPKGILKIPHPSRPAPSLSTDCNSMQSCSKRAIAFSKRQMHEVECLALKLTKELKSMKDIVDDMLRSELCLTTSLRYKVNEARIAVKNATRTEETAKRYLSVMSRDCSRFCKLMQLADDGPSAPQDLVRKERKKISFADEAGGRLCQVRFYENVGVSLLESDCKERLP